MLDTILAMGSGLIGGLLLWAVIRDWRNDNWSNRLFVGSIALTHITVSARLAWLAGYAHSHPTFLV